MCQGQGASLGACCWRAALLYGHPDEYLCGVWGQQGGLPCVTGSALRHTGGGTSSELLAPERAERWAGKLGGRRRRLGATFVRMEMTVSPIQSVASFPGDNCKTGLLVLKNS